MGSRGFSDVPTIQAEQSSDSESEDLDLLRVASFFERAMSRKVDGCEMNLGTTYLWADCLSRSPQEKRVPLFYPLYWRT